MHRLEQSVTNVLITGKKRAADRIPAIQRSYACRCTDVPYFQMTYKRISADSQAIKGDDAPLEADARIWSSELIATVRMSVR